MDFENHNRNVLVLSKVRDELHDRYGENELVNMIYEKIDIMKLRDLSCDELRDIFEGATDKDIQEHPIYYLAVSECWNQTDAMKERMNERAKFMDELFDTGLRVIGGDKIGAKSFSEINELKKTFKIIN